MSRPSADFSDAELWQACRDGQEPAWGLLVRRYQRLIFTIARRAGSSEDAAADVLQFTFAALFQQLDRIQDASRLRAWLVTTAKRETLRLREQAQRMPVAAAGLGSGYEEEPDPLAAIPDPGPMPEELLSRLQQEHLLGLALQRLDERSRRLIELMFMQDEPLPYAEIAARLGVPAGSLGPTRARCLAKLRAVLLELDAGA